MTYQVSAPLSPKHLKIIESYRDNTTSSPEQCARNTGFPIAEVRRVYGLGGR